jgi:hypothetical protein
VEAARAEVLGLIRVSVTVFVCKHPRNRKGGRDALDKAFLGALGSINHPYVSGEKRPLSNASRRGEDRGPIPVNVIQSRTRTRVHVIVPFRGPERIRPGQPEPIEEMGRISFVGVWTGNDYHCLITLRWSWNVYEGV